MVTPAKASEKQWYGHILRRDSDDVSRALDFEMFGRARATDDVEKTELKKEDAFNRPKWSDAVNKLLRIMR